MSKRSLQLLLLVGLAAGCSSNPEPRGPETVEGQIPIAAPTWVPLNVPQSEITLPAFMVGEQGQMSSGCWKGATSKEGQVADTFKWEESKQRQLDANFKAAFKKYLVDAKLDASLLDALTQTWKLELSGVGYLTVDPAEIRPNFANRACTEAELEWFKAGRLVVTQGIKAKTAVISATTQATTEQQAQLDLAISKINTEFHTGFKRSSSGTDNLKIEATDAFIGAIGTTLVARECSNPKPFKVTADEFGFCNNKYTISIKGASVGDRATLSVTPKSGTTAVFDLEVGKQGVFQVDELRVMFAKVSKTSSGLVVDNLNILLVGASGQHDQG